MTSTVYDWEHDEVIDLAPTNFQRWMLRILIIGGSFKLSILGLAIFFNQEPTATKVNIGLTICAIAFIAIVSVTFYYFAWWKALLGLVLSFGLAATAASLFAGILRSL